MKAKRKKSGHSMPKSVRASKILVTGSHGFLGSAFVGFLRSRNIAYVEYDREHPDTIPEEVDRVIHFAGITPTSATSGTLAEYRAANVEGTRRLLEALVRQGGIKRFVNVGSAAEYGPAATSLTETALEHPVGPYGISKTEQRKLVEQFSRAQGIPTVHVRLFNIAALRSRRAPGTSSHSPTIFDSVIEQLEVGERVTLTHPDTVRDFVSMDDLVEAFWLALTAPGIQGYEIVNLATGVGTKLGSIAQSIGQLLGRTPLFSSRARHPDISIGNARKAARLLGWVPKISLDESLRRMVGARIRVCIVGAGVGGRAVVRELLHDGRAGIVVVGLVDDDLKKQGKRVLGVPVLGIVEDLPRLVEEHAVDQVLIAAPSAGSELNARVVRILRPGFPIKIVPSASSVLLRGVGLSSVRDLDFADIVGRPLIKADQQFIAEKTRGKTFLVTGAAGSIGSEIMRQLYSTNVRRIVALDAWEEGVFNLLEELKLVATKGSPELVVRIGNIRDRARLDEIFKEFSIDVIIHAAAYKHVPLMEDNPDEARKTNVVGTKNLLDRAVEYGVRDFLLISTDKAVHPASVMGKTKRAAELLVEEYAKRYPRTRHMAVRFGNVLNSSGSVIPTFLRQIKNRRPITITHPEMTRYFMSIPEAVSLVLLSWIVGKNGQIMVLDMGAPVRILDLAIQLVHMHGLEPYRDIPIEITGIRPGEKLHEELAYEGALKKSSFDRIFIAEESHLKQLP